MKNPITIDNFKFYQEYKKRDLSVEISYLLCALIDELDNRGVININELFDKMEADIVMQKISK